MLKSSNMAEYRSLRREIDEVTRQYQERCGAFEKKLHEYDDAQAEAARLFALATDLQVQIGVCLQRTLLMRVD